MNTAPCFTNSDRLLAFAEPSRYVPFSSCDFYLEYFPGIDTNDSRGLADAERRRFADLGGDIKEWHREVTAKLMDASRSPSPYRALYLPFLPDKVKFSPYILYKRSKGV